MRIDSEEHTLLWHPLFMDVYICTEKTQLLCLQACEHPLNFPAFTAIQEISELYQPAAYLTHSVKL